MPHPQFPIGSGFGAATTAQAVLAGLDLSHATAIVTGGHSGLGLETTRALAQAGASSSRRATPRPPARRLATSPGSRSNRWISPGWTACAISPGASWPADSMSTC